MTQQVLKIDIDKIKESPYQGRLLLFEESDPTQSNKALLQLAANIKENGLLNPIVVRGIDDGYELIDGHRRLAAHKLNGETKIEALIKEADDRTAQVISVVSNLQREDLSTIEKALAFKKILEAGVFKDQKELSAAISKDQTFVGDLLNTLNMDNRIVDDLLKNKTTNDVRLLRAIRRSDKTDNEGKSDGQWSLYQRFINEGLSRAEVLKLAKNQFSDSHKDVVLQFKPRRIEVDLPKKYDKKQRDILSKLLKEKIEEILTTFE